MRCIRDPLQQRVGEDRGRHGQDDKRQHEADELTQAQRHAGQSIDDRLSHDHDAHDRVEDEQHSREQVAEGLTAPDSLGRAIAPAFTAPMPSEAARNSSIAQGPSTK